MFFTFVAGLALHQQSATFQFKPKVGDKLRYSMSVSDENGQSQLPAGLKMYSVFKVAGVKDGKYTVHAMIEDGSAPTSDPHVVGSFRVDSQLRSEMVSTDQETEEGAAGAGMAGKILGAFGLQFSETPMKVGETWKPAFDANAIGKAFVEGATHIDNPKVDTDGNITVTLQKLDEKVGTFQSLMHLKVDTSVDEDGRTHQLSITIDCDQMTSVDRETGVPTVIDRKFSISMKMDSETHMNKIVMHLVKV